MLDSGFMLGDGVWEGIRLHKGVLVFLEEHLDRLWEGAKAIDMELGVSKERLQQMVYHTVDANGMAQVGWWRDYCAGLSDADGCKGTWCYM